MKKQSQVFLSFQKHTLLIVCPKLFINAKACVIEKKEKEYEITE